MRSEDACVLQGPSVSLHRGDGGEANPELDSGSSEVDVTAGIHVDSTVNEDALRVVAVVAAAAQAASIEDIPATSLPPTKEDYLHNELNPPLVPATLILVQAVEHTVDPLTIIQVHEQPSVPQVVSQHQQSTDLLSSDVVRVYVDDEQSTPNQQDQEEKKVKRRGYWKIFLIPVICIIVGASIGLAVGYNGGRSDGISEFEKQKVPSPVPDILHHNMTFRPSRSASPSAAPSCAQGFSFAWAENHTGMSSYPVFVSGATFRNLKQTLGVFAYYDIFYGKSTIKTFVLSTETGIQEEIEQEFNEPFEVRSLAVSDDGVTLVVGVKSYVSEVDGVGGAFMIFQRFKPNTDLTWNLTQVRFTGGEGYGSVVAVAINDNGTVVAVSAVDVNWNMLVSVYQVSGIGLEPMRGQFPAENVTAVALSGDGSRLFMATLDSRIYVFDFFFRDGWASSGKLFFESKDATLHASRDGSTLVVGGNRDYSIYPVKIYALIDSRWETLDSISGNDAGVYCYLPALSKDGNNLFLTGLFLDNMDAEFLGGDWFRREQDGFKNIYSVQLGQEHSYSWINGVQFNEDMSQLVISTGLGLIGLQRSCASEVVVPSPTPKSPTISPAPTACFAGFGDPRFFNVSDELKPVLFDGDPFTVLSQDGSTVVVTNAITNTSICVVTLVMSQNEALILTEALEVDFTYSHARSDLIATSKMSVIATGLSGDGRTLMYGMSSYVQRNGSVGGAFLVYRRANVTWEFVGVIETGGGDLGAVFDVTSSFDGSVVAFSTGAVGGDAHVDVYVVSENGFFSKNKQGIPEASINAPASAPTSNDDILVDHAGSTKPGRPHVMLSGSGERLFVSTSGAVRSFDFDDGCECWFQVGNTIFDASYGEIKVSFAGNIVVISRAFFPIQLLELQDDYWIELESSTLLNDNDNQNENLDLVALSPDGKSIFVAHKNRLSSSATSPMQAPLPYHDNSTFPSVTGTTIPEHNDASTGYMHVTLDGYLIMIQNFALDRGLLLGATLDAIGNLVIVSDEGTSVYPGLCTLVL